VIRIILFVFGAMLIVSFCVYVQFLHNKQIGELQKQISESRKPINVVIKFTAKQTEKYEMDLILNMDDGTEWGRWLGKPKYWNL
jgi:hypothetical protein